MMELLDVVIWLEDAREVRRSDIPNGIKLFERSLNGEKHGRNPMGV